MAIDAEIVVLSIYSTKRKAQQTTKVEYLGTTIMYVSFCVHKNYERIDI